MWQSFDQVKTWWRTQNGVNVSLTSETTAIQIFETGSVKDNLDPGGLPQQTMKKM